MKTLSILICSLENRKELLVKLLRELRGQTHLYKVTCCVELIVETDDGTMSTGAKRNLLLQRATGDYICFVDDDDMVSGDYIEKIMVAINEKSEPDCCSLQGEIHFSKGKLKGQTRIFKHSILYNSWYTTKDNVHHRCPNHLNVVKRELALQVKFPEKDIGEDKDYSMRLFDLLKTEEQIHGTIYYYRA